MRLIKPTAWYAKDQIIRIIDGWGFRAEELPQSVRAGENVVTFTIPELLRHIDNCTSAQITRLTAQRYVLEFIVEER